MKRILTLRSLSGLSGDMMLAGLWGLSGLSRRKVDELVAKIGVPKLNGAVALKAISVGGISGFQAQVRLGHEHAHRTFSDIAGIVKASKLSPKTKTIALRAFSCLASAEAKIHGIQKSRVVFHEIGSLDSILDICLASALFCELKIDTFVSSPLPLCDGAIRCRHGVLLSPAPATLALLKDAEVSGLRSHGETVTPSAAALLKAMRVQFGPWPRMVLRASVHSYGTRTLPGVPNGAIFALGQGR